MNRITLALLMAITNFGIACKKKEIIPTDIRAKYVGVYNMHIRTQSGSGSPSPIHDTSYHCKMFVSYSTNDSVHVGGVYSNNSLPAITFFILNDNSSVFIKLGIDDKNNMYLTNPPGGGVSGGFISTDSVNIYVNRSYNHWISSDELKGHKL